MKKVLFILLLMGAYICPTIAQTQSDSETLSFEEIVILDSAQGRPRQPRSIVHAAVEAYVDYEAQTIEVDFNDDLGTATVTVFTSAGQRIAYRTCNTQAEGIIWLPLPPSGSYRIEIRGNEYEGYGNFTIR